MKVYPVEIMFVPMVAAESRSEAESLAYSRLREFIQHEEPAVFALTEIKVASDLRQYDCTEDVVPYGQGPRGKTIAELIGSWSIRKDQTP